HYSVAKAVNLLGLGREGLLRVPTGPDGRLDPARVEERIAAARADGAEPFCLIGIAGTTVTGTIEPLGALGEIARRHGLWYHVDAAYGGSLILSGTHASRLHGIEAADSVTWNPQKWLFVPKACASILYRDPDVLETTIRERFVYGRDDGGDAAGPNLGEYTIQGTRRVDVLKLWLTLEHLGTARLGRLIDRNLERAALLARGIEESEGIDLLANPDLNIVCFRARLPDDGSADDGRLDALQTTIQEEVAREAEIWLSLPRYRGRRILRAVVLHPDAGEERIEALLGSLRAAVAAPRR
ncbi:MAG: aspartate aminotransferase family protein, partial [Candidatus Eisenbacteria bacterium]|nr:aspartate aminotransferase family protein [Candidatus Latescibacterota bacterium]MBD3300817.1 aspartate aminotransferase family protein [Candidatus Eisenbacteria bacterium]